MELKDVFIGENKVARMYHKAKVIYPTPIQDGLILWYDFMGRGNNDTKRDVAEDLSGNSNNGDLQNFVFENDSGYEDGLVFDGVDDLLLSPILNFTQENDFSIEMSFCNETERPGIYTMFLNVSAAARDYFALYNAPTSRIFIPYAFGVSIRTADKIETVGKRSFTLTYSSESRDLKMYLNGESLSIENYATSEISFRIQGLRPLWYTQAHPMSLYSFKVYDKTLTKEEVIYNHALEKSRWNL